MSEEPSEYDWDNLSDSEWNKRLDEFIDQFNDERGVIKPPPHAIMDNE